ncbi:cyclohexanone monooxygenase [Myriangium duriaei CBS 260.36]|uniref:Cyclohexanone monooxygenase n=1 Tax=Myriangium duriaei CBS 260.36 TaxID=1168546 RepID=A0A9P4J385_9PEZI|nr:cyclohexanone monooxygenase [Myriangium duriaei CBS 260.36]
MDSPQSEHNFDVLIIGAGLSGVCSLHHLRQRFPQWRIKVLEAGGGPGGTWYWNCYPGARFDCESLSYSFSFDQDLLQEWNWKDTFSAQPETLEYIERVCEKLDLYTDMQFNTQVKAAHWQQSDGTWLLTDQTGRQYSSRFLVSCIGFLSTPTRPAVPGIDDFAGQHFHTSQWPKEFDIKRDFRGKRIGVIGTGATGIQTITEVAKHSEIESLSVFQRTATWTAPLRNTSITPEQMIEYKKSYSDIFKVCSETPMGFMHKADPRRSLDLSEEERRDYWEEIYAEPGFRKWIGNFSDTYTDPHANELYSAFIADKIRGRVKDPVLAEKLVPRNHGFGTRRVPLESGYFEVFNQPKVHLVDLKETPIEQVTPRGIRTSDGEQHDLDILIYATGFDAITGAFRAIDWRVKDDRHLLGFSNTEEGERAVWKDHKPRTFLGLTAPSVPNMIMVMGPHQPFGNATRSIEHAVNVAVGLLQHCDDNGFTWFEPTEEAVVDWTKHVFDCAQGALSNEVDSWMTGVNSNVKGKSERTVARYAGSVIEYRRRCAECKANNWQGLVFH